MQGDRGAAGEPESVPPTQDQATAPAAAYCANHPSVKATVRCQMCRAVICDTCVFSFPGGMRTCPACATREPELFTPKRRRMMITSYVCAAIVTLFYGLMLSGLLLPTDGTATESDFQALGVLMMIVVLGGSVTGMAMATGAKPPGGGMPIVLLVPWIWNLLLIIGLLLLTVLGNMS